MKTKFYYTICNLFVLVLLVSCSGSSDTPTFTNMEGINALKTKLNDTFDKDKQVNGIGFLAQNTNVDAIEQINIYFPENNKNTLWFYSYATSQLHKPEATQELKNVPKTNALSAFNIDECHTYFKDAIALIGNETDEFSNYRVNSYDMMVDQTSGKIKHVFTLNTDKKTAKRTFYGRKINDYLYQFQFETNKDGQLESTYGLDVFDD